MDVHVLQQEHLRAAEPHAYRGGVACADPKLIGQGAALVEVCKQLEISEPTWHRWVARYGGMKADDAKRLKELERENARLRKIVADQLLDIDLLKELNKGNW
ncbi:MAG: transposase [Micromonosporaceae bacterium]